MTVDLGTVLGVVAAALYLTSYSMKSMLPLRALAVASNVFFIAYGIVQSALPELVLHSVLLPLNASRLWEIRKLTEEIARATQDSPVSQWLSEQRFFYRLRNCPVGIAGTRAPRRPAATECKAHVGNPEAFQGNRARHSGFSGFTVAAAPHDAPDIQSRRSSVPQRRACGRGRLHRQRSGETSGARSSAGTG